jgi:hypothetical protein
MRGVLAVVGVAVAVGGTVTGCSSSSKSDAQGGGATATGQVSATQTQATQSQSPTVVASPSPTQTASSPAPAQPSAGVSISAQGVPTSIDPCQLVPQAEASTLAGASFGPGKEETAGLSKRCTYGGQTLNVFTVEAAEATDATAAQAAWDDAQAQVNTELKQQVPAGVNLAVANTAVTGIGDKAAVVSGTATIQGQTIGISGIYVLKGAKFFAFQDLKLGTPPSAAAMEAEAQQALGRL